ncbi:MAG TPA: hypothetical protein VJZ71_15140 [Phycisphaerae bacterium]|nr:hypothetical protein [Phycisphaerae bacterium]
MTTINSVAAALIASAFISQGTVKPEQAIAVTPADVLIFFNTACSRESCG